MPKWMENMLKLKDNKNLISFKIHPEPNFTYADKCTIRPVSPNFYFIQNEDWVNDSKLYHILNIIYLGVRDAFDHHKVLYKGKILKVSPINTLPITIAPIKEKV